VLAFIEGSLSGTGISTAQEKIAEWQSTRFDVAKGIVEDGCTTTMLGEGMNTSQPGGLLDADPGYLWTGAKAKAVEWCNHAQDNSLVDISNTVGSTGKTYKVMISEAFQTIWFEMNPVADGTVSQNTFHITVETEGTCKYMKFEVPGPFYSVIYVLHLSRQPLTTCDSNSLYIYTGVESVSVHPNYPMVNQQTGNLALYEPVIKNALNQVRFQAVQDLVDHCSTPPPTPAPENPFGPFGVPRL
jgi:hypothetical protein